MHWHGIELESFPDGVPGWSGAGTTSLPFIMPGDSLTVRFTPPRAGTFMYHSHSNEMQQIASGTVWRDHRARARCRRRFGRAHAAVQRRGPDDQLLQARPAGAAERQGCIPDTIDVPAGRATRLRLINIRAENATEFALEQDGMPVLWRAVAKDGAALPPHQIREQPAKLITDPGETYDFEITPDQARHDEPARSSAEPGDTTSAEHAVIRVHFDAGLVQHPLALMPRAAHHSDD